ncbi:MAG: hypothetical protein K5657_06330 [Desulfovibrio sp.]|nr:hypothetical protein [Desulfovibrio sp.]
MSFSCNALFFDRQDKAVLALVNRILDSPTGIQGRLFDPNLHPHGIEELVAPPVERMAYAVVNLLRNLEAGSGQVEDRLLALQTLYDEVLNSAHSTLRRNTARVLMQIMKDMVRSHGDQEMQLRLAHDFRSVVHGTPRIVRRMLLRYHLPEMPEEWNQLTFDDHVYDVNTRGRKTPTHLIMDAWIKGIRSLTVAYEYCLEAEAARELMRAAEITGISVRIGLEFQVAFYDHSVRFFWIPRGFSSNDDFLSFLHDPELVSLLDMGREVLAWRKERILNALNAWNSIVRPAVNEEWETDIPELSKDDFLTFCRGGNPTRERLAECIHGHVYPAMQKYASRLIAMGQDGAAALAHLETMSPDVLMDEWLSCEHFSGMPDCCINTIPDDAPPLMRMSPKELTRLLTSIAGGYRLILGVTDLSLEDAVEILWECEGAVTHLEIFNMKSWVEGRLPNIESIASLQRSLNLGHGPRIKRLLQKLTEKLRANGEDERAIKFQEILGNINTLWEHYRHTPLKCRLGTSSASRLTFGMGLVLRETLPKRAQSELDRKQMFGKPIPFHAPVEEHMIYREPENPSLWQCFLSLFSVLPGCRHLGMEKQQQWKLASEDFRVAKQGNIVNLGGISVFEDNNFTKKQHEKDVGHRTIYYLNTSVVNWLKVLLGFIPAFFSFYFVQDWWVLAWFGAFIWFGITGIRNVLQMVMTARGASKGTLVHWTEQVSVPRLCDSLMYTGISVLLLEVLVRVVLLQNICGITVDKYPFFVYTVLNCVNALYIVAHNIYRGFPRQAAIGNIFRSALSIPVASFYDLLLKNFLLGFGVADPAVYLVPSAAIISKLASDTVAAIIEGYADGQVNLRMRRWDYKSKVDQVFDSYNRLELLFPQEDGLKKISHVNGVDSMAPEVKAIERTFVINALDLMYFWFFQPRAQEALLQLLKTMTHTDRMVLAKAQLILAREHFISQILVDGLLGRNFSRPLAFFLGNHRSYLRQFLSLCRQLRHHGMPYASKNRHID